MPHRLFIGIRPPAPVRDALLDTMEALEGARWVDGDNLHLTLRFVGEVERPAANDLAEALGQIDWARFTLRIAGSGDRQCHVVWRSCEQVGVEFLPDTPSIVPSA